LILSSTAGGKMPDSPLLRTPMRAAHCISFQKQNVLEKISSDLATLILPHALLQWRGNVSCRPVSSEISDLLLFQLFCFSE